MVCYDVTIHEMIDISYISLVEMELKFHFSDWRARRAQPRPGHWRDVRGRTGSEIDVRWEDETLTQPHRPGPAGDFVDVYSTL